MARLPSAEDLGQRPTPAGRGGISRLQLTTPRRGAEAQAEAQFGQAIAGLGDTLAVLAINEKKKIDSARTEESSSTYQDSLLDLEYGEQNGFTKILGGDAIKQPLVEDYRKRREVIAKQIRDGLDSEDQKIGFDNRASIIDRQFDGRLYRHVSEQSNVYQEQTSQAVFATERRAAALNYEQPNQIAMSLLRTDMEIERLARIRGLPPETVENMKVVAGSQIHTDVMQQMLNQGKDKSAAAYYNQIKNELTPDAMVAVGAKIEAASVDGDALRTADLAWQVSGPKTMDDTVRIDIGESFIRDRLGDNPAALKAAVQDYRSRAIAFKDGQQEMKASNEATVLEEYHNGADLSSIQTLPAYQALDGASKTKVRDYIVNRGRTEQQHARHEASYRAGIKKTQSMSAYWEMSNPEVLNGLSEKQIIALEPVLGTEIMGDLVQAKRKLSSPENLKAATMDAKQFNLIAAQAGLDVYNKNLSPEQKENLGMLHNEVMTAIDREQRSGKVLGYEEKGALMQKIMDKQVYTDGWGTSTPTMPAAIVKPDQRSQVFVPIDKVDTSWFKGAANFMRSEGMAPTDWDDATIKKNMRGRLERAYAIRLTGGSAEEIKKALAGKDDGIRQ